MPEDNTADFESTALPYLRELFRAAVGMVGDTASAEDVVQEVYLRAWRSFKSYRPGTNCRAWLYKILINCIHDYRRRWMNSRVVTDPELLVALEDGHACALPMSQEVTDEQILEGIRELPLHYSAVLLMSDVEDLTYREIAGILDVPLGTVMSRLSRARGILRTRLAEVAGSYGIGRGCQRGVPA